METTLYSSQALLCISSPGLWRYHVDRLRQVLAVVIPAKVSVVLSTVIVAGYVSLVRIATCIA